MKNMVQQRNKKGQTLLEIIAVLVIIGVVLSAVIPAVTAGTDNGRVQSAITSIRAIQSAAIGYYNDSNGSYANISMANLVPKYLPSGTTSDPWGGTISVAGNGTSTNQYIVTMTKVPSSAGGANGPLQIQLQNTAIATTYTPTSSQFQATLS